MEPVSEGYPKVVSEKDGGDTYNSIPEEMEVEEGSCLKVITQPLTMTLPDAKMREGRREAGVRSGTSDSKDTNPSDDGLKQLREFVQATEGQQDSVVKAGKEGSRTDVKVVSEVHMREKNGRMVSNKLIKCTTGEGSGVSVMSKVCAAAEQLVETCKDSLKREINATKTGMEKLTSGSQDVTRFRNFQHTQGNSRCAGGRESEKRQNTMLEVDEDEDDDDDSSDESESEATELIQVVGAKEVQGAKVEGDSDSSDSDEEGDSDSSTSSSGSDSSSSDSDSDGSESESDSDSDSKRTDDKEKTSVTTTTAAAAATAAVVVAENSTVKITVNAAIVSERKESEVKVKEDAILPDKRKPSDLIRLVEKIKPGDRIKTNDQSSSSDPNKPNDKTRSTEPPKDAKKIRPYQEESARETKLHTQTDTERRRSPEESEEGHAAHPEATKDMDTLSTTSSDTERKSKITKDTRRTSPAQDSKNSLKTKLEESIRTDKTPCSIKVTNEKLFNNNSISITKSQAGLSTSNNNFTNKKNSVVKNASQLTSKLTAGLPKLTSRTSGTNSTSQKASNDRTPVDLVQEVAATFAKQLSVIQANQLRNSNTNTDRTQNTHTDEPKLPQTYHSPSQTLQDLDEEEDEEKGDSEIEDMFPIQAEVVMSEGSESGLEYENFPDQPHQDDLSWCKKGSEVLDPSEKENVELMDYLRSYVSPVRSYLVFLLKSSFFLYD